MLKSNTRDVAWPVPTPRAYRQNGILKTHLARIWQSPTNEYVYTALILEDLAVTNRTVHLRACLWACITQDCPFPAQKFFPLGLSCLRIRMDPNPIAADPSGSFLWHPRILLFLSTVTGIQFLRWNSSILLIVPGGRKRIRAATDVRAPPC